MVLQIISIVKPSHNVLSVHEYFKRILLLNQACVNNVVQQKTIFNHLYVMIAFANFLSLGEHRKKFFNYSIWYAKDFYLNMHAYPGNMSLRKVAWWHSFEFWCYVLRKHVSSRLTDLLKYYHPLTLVKAD